MHHVPPGPSPASPHGFAHSCPCLECSPKVQPVPDILSHNVLCFPLSARLGSGGAGTLRELTLPQWYLAHTQHRVGTYLFGALRDLECHNQVGKGGICKSMWDTQDPLPHLYPHPSPTESNYISTSMEATLSLPVPGHLIPPPPRCPCPCNGLCALFSTSYMIWLSHTSA